MCMLWFKFMYIVKRAPALVSHAHSNIWVIMEFHLKFSPSFWCCRVVTSQRMSANKNSRLYEDMSDFLMINTYTEKMAYIPHVFKMNFVIKHEALNCVLNYSQPFWYRLANNVLKFLPRLKIWRHRGLRFHKTGDVSSKGGVLKPCRMPRTSIGVNNCRQPSVISVQTIILVLKQHSAVGN